MITGDPDTSHNDPPRTAREILLLCEELDARYARGELTKKEWMHLKARAMVDPIMAGELENPGEPGPGEG